MAQISDVAAFFCEHYPHKAELSKTRLTKLVYLADWEAAKKLKRQITNINWFFHNYGPYVEDVFSAVSSDKRFEVTKSQNFYGDEKIEIKLRAGHDSRRNLSDEEITILESVIDKTKTMYWNAFIKHVYSTPPIEMSDRYTNLDLVSLAKSG